MTETKGEWKSDMHPTDGDIVAHCGHEDVKHMFAVNVPLEDCGDIACPGESTWYSCCDGCFPEAMQGRLRIGGHASWMGNEDAGFKLPSSAN